MLDYTGVGMNLRLYDLLTTNIYSVLRKICKSLFCIMDSIIDSIMDNMQVIFYKKNGIY
jgi:hypothetical protein